MLEPDGYRRELVVTSHLYRNRGAIEVIDASKVARLGTRCPELSFPVATPAPCLVVRGRDPAGGAEDAVVVLSVERREVEASDHSRGADDGFGE